MLFCEVVVSRNVDDEVYGRAYCQDLCYDVLLCSEISKGRLFGLRVKGELGSERRKTW